jgi:hypothetical protein
VQWRPLMLDHSIVAIHGLDGHREKSWTVNEVNWLRDLLSTDIPNARIMSWGYDARTHSFSHIGGKYIYDHGRTLISDLCVKRALTKVYESNGASSGNSAKNCYRVQDVLSFLLLIA